MRVLVTGATGFIGSHLVRDLLAAGHRVAGLTRSDAGAERLAALGAEPVRGDVTDLPGLREAAAAAEGVIHTAFNHDFSRLQEMSEIDRSAIGALGAALAGSDRPLVVASGTGLVRPKPGMPAEESDGPMGSATFARGATEEAADALIAAGGRVMVVRLPQVHDTRHQGRIAQHILLARQHGRVAIVGEGRNRLPAAHVSDVVRLFRLALEQGRAGARYHAVAEEGVALRDIAAVIGAGLGLPVVSLTGEEAAAYFGWLAGLAAMDLAATGARTRSELAWTPTGPDLLTDLRATDFSAVSAG